MVYQAGFATIVRISQNCLDRAGGREYYTGGMADRNSDKQGRVSSRGVSRRSGGRDDASAIPSARPESSRERSELTRKLYYIRPDLAQMFRMGALSVTAAERVLGAVAYDGRTPAFVYFIQGTEGGPIKIGRAVDVLKRLEQIQRCSPIPLRILAVVLEDGRRGDTPSNETALHQLFEKDRLWGEWFRPTTFLLGYIRDVRITGRT